MDSERRVGLEIGSDHRDVRIVRLVASGMASLAGFDIEAVEDLRIAVDEACVWLIDRGAGGRIHLLFVNDTSNAITVTGEVALGAEAGDGVLGALVEQILAASCADHRFDISDTHASFRLVSRNGSRAMQETQGER